MAPAQAAAEGRGRGRAEAKNMEGYDDQQQTQKTMEKTVVCVMDASGSLGAALVDSLLQRGYVVHAAFQSHSHSHSQEQLQNMKVQCGSDSDKNLKIFQADLLDYHSIIDTLNGCSALFYTFEPPPEHLVYDEHMADTEVRAANNVLEACAQTPTMTKVIFTSSATAVVWTDTHNSSSTSSSDDIDEKSWSDINLCKKFKLWHALSKTLAEKTAWALAMDREVSMVSINAGLLLENHNSLNAPEAVSPNNKHKIPSHLPPYLKGAAEMYEQGVLVAVDLRFLVDAHICIFEDDSYGRYLCFNHVINCHDDAVKLATMFMPSPPQSSEDTRVHPQRISNKKLNNLMVNLDSQLKLHK